MGIAQLGERQTEDLKVACSIHAHRIFCFVLFRFNIDMERALIFSPSLLPMESEFNFNSIRDKRVYSESRVQVQFESEFE